MIPLGLLVIYSLIASNSSELLALEDKGVTPLVDGLYYVGLGVAKPFMEGPMPERYYANLVGIGVWGVVAYNVRTIVWYVSKGVRTTSKKEKWVEIKKRWGIVGLGVAIIFALLSIIFFASYLVLTLMNSSHGWFVFHVRDLFTPIITVMAWVLPGALITAFWWLIAWVLINSFISAYQYFH